MGNISPLQIDHVIQRMRSGLSLTHVENKIGLMLNLSQLTNG